MKLASGLPLSLRCYVWSGAYWWWHIHKPILLRIISFCGFVFFTEFSLKNHKCPLVQIIATRPSSVVLLTRVPRCHHNSDVIMGSIASQITSLTIVFSSFYSDADQRKHQSSPSLASVRGIPTEMASNAENLSVWWRHYDAFNNLMYLLCTEWRFELSFTG